VAFPNLTTLGLTPVFAFTTFFFASFIVVFFTGAFRNFLGATLRTGRVVLITVVTFVVVVLVIFFVVVVERGFRAAVLAFTMMKKMLLDKRATVHSFILCSTLS
jgi:hypothetical protein